MFEYVIIIIIIIIMDYTHFIKYLGADFIKY